MKNQTKKSNTTSSNRGYSIEESKLMKLFEDELKDMYWAEKALTKAAPKMIKNATSDKLVDVLESHFHETEGHVGRLEDVFETIGKKAVAKKCEAMAGLIKEAEDLMRETDKGAMRDAAIISAAQKIEHYEIASYGTLRTFAQTLGLDDVVSLLEETLDQEKSADHKLTEVAESTINVEAMEEMEAEEE